MKVRAIRVIRSAHLDACIHLAGETGKVKHKMKRFNSEIYLIHWDKDGSECVVVPEDVEVLSNELVLSNKMAPTPEQLLNDNALTVMPEHSIEAASSSCREPVPATRGMTGQEPVGTLPLFCNDERHLIPCPLPCKACKFAECSSYYDLGGEG